MHTSPWWSPRAILSDIAGFFGRPEDFLQLGVFFVGEVGPSLKSGRKSSAGRLPALAGELPETAAARTENTVPGEQSFGNLTARGFPFGRTTSFTEPVKELQVIHGQRHAQCRRVRLIPPKNTGRPTGNRTLTVPVPPVPEYRRRTRRRSYAPSGYGDSLF